jgi:hypothetical protein
MRISNYVSMPTLTLLVSALTGCIGTDMPATRCGAPPASLPILWTTTPSGATVHWTMPENCVPVTVDPSLESRRSQIDAAITAWRAVSCNRMCFRLSQPSTQAPSITDRRLHFTASTATNIAINFENNSGKILNATVNLQQGLLSGAPEQLFLRSIGKAMGMNQPSPGVASVLDLNTTVTMLTDADRTSVCAIYGQTPFCSE